MKELKILAQDLLFESRYEAIALAVINLKNFNVDQFQIKKNGKNIIDTDEDIYFDLASITKPLTMGLSYLLNPKQITNEMLYLMEHRGGLPAWGLLSKDNWREHIMSFNIKESETLYSDFSALRYMLEFEKKEKLYPILKKFYDPEIKFWNELDKKDICLKNGTRMGKEVRGQVHDPNAYTIGEFCTHAGLFSTLNGIVNTLIKAEKEFQLSSKIPEEFQKRKYATRFAWAFDRVEDPKISLVGPHSSINTFGHFGFTGTSFWFHPEKMVATVLLSNATCEYWYDKKQLNILRKKLGEYAWT
jgi:hypothetical protein